MFLPFMFLLLLCGGIGVVVWLGWQKVAEHMRKNPEAAELLAKHVIAPLLAGEPEATPEVKPEQPKS